MKFEFVYIGLAVIFCAVYFLLQKKNVFGGHVHSEVLIRGMKINLILNIATAVGCLLSILVIDSVSAGIEIRYAIDLFRFLLRTPRVTSKAMLCMNIAVYIVNVVSMVVAARISVKRRGHKNLKLEKTLTSDFVLCGACTALSTLELAICFLLFV